MTYNFDLDTESFKEILKIILRVFDNEKEETALSLTAHAHQYIGKDILDRRVITISKQDLRNIGLKDDNIPTEDEVEEAAMLIEHKVFSEKELSNSGVTFFSNLRYLD